MVVKVGGPILVASHPGFPSPRLGDPANRSNLNLKLNTIPRPIPPGCMFVVPRLPPLGSFLPGSLSLCHPRSATVPLVLLLLPF